MTSDKPDMLIDRAEAERLIKQAQYDRAEFMRDNIKHVIWAMGVYRNTVCPWLSCLIRERPSALILSVISLAPKETQKTLLPTFNPKQWRPSMRAHHVIAVVAVLAIGLGIKQFLFPPMPAIANVGQSESMNVMQMQIDQKNKNIPQQEMNDMTFVYPNP